MQALRMNVQGFFSCMNGCQTSPQTSTEFFVLYEDAHAHMFSERNISRSYLMICFNGYDSIFD